MSSQGLRIERSAGGHGFRSGFLKGFRGGLLGTSQRRWGSGAVELVSEALSSNDGGSHRGKNRVRYFETARAVARCSVR